MRRWCGAGSGVASMGMTCAAFVAAAQEGEREGGCPGEGEGERGEQGDGHGEGEGAEEGSGDAGDRDEGQEDNDGGDGGTDEGAGDFGEGFADGFDAIFAGFTMEGDVFDDDDGVIDDEADGGSESAEGHEVEALADGPEDDKCNSNGYRNDEAGDEGGSPVAQEEDDDDGGEDESDEDGIADAGDAVANEMGLVVEGGDGDAGGQIGAELGDGGGDFVGDGDGVRVGLLEDVEEDGGLAVGGNDGVDGLRGRDDLSDVGEVDGHAGGRGFDGNGGELLEVGGLVADQREDELVIGFVEAGRLDEVGLLDGVDEVGDGERGGDELRGVGDDVEFGDLAALDGDGGDAREAIEGRLELVGGQFPEAGLRDGCRR